MEYCTFLQLSGRLTCGGDDDWSCCVKTEVFVEGTVSATTTSATSTTTNEDYNVNSFEEISDSLPDPYVCVNEKCISRVNCGDTEKIDLMTRLHIFVQMFLFNAQFLTHKILT